MFTRHIHIIQPPPVQQTLTLTSVTPSHGSATGVTACIANGTMLDTINELTVNSHVVPFTVNSSTQISFNLDGGFCGGSVGAAANIIVVRYSDDASAGGTTLFTFDQTAPPPNPPPGTGLNGVYSTGMQWRGINRSGPEWGEEWDGWTGQTGYDMPSTSEFNAELTYLDNVGFNYVRFCISWVRIQHTLFGPLNTTYVNQLVANMQAATAKGFYVGIDLHAYNRYASGVFTSDQGTTQGGGWTEHIFNDGFLTNAHVCDVWAKIASYFVGNNHILFDLMNESHDFPMTSDNYVLAINAQIAAIRATGATNMILIPNSRASDVTHFVGSTPWSNAYSPNGGSLDSVAFAGSAVKDSASNWAFGIHQYQYMQNAPDAPTTLLQPFTTWARTNGKKALLSEYGIIPGNANAQAAVQNLMSFLNANNDVWLGMAPWNLTPYITVGGNMQSDSTATAWYKPYLTPHIASSGGAPTLPPSSSYPTSPMSSSSYSLGSTFQINVNGITSYVVVPSGYDTSHNTPTTLFMWCHGATGYASGDINMVRATGANGVYIACAVGGFEGGSWNTNMNAGVQYIMDAVAYLKTKFNINPQKVIMGGYSAGGDVAYLTMFTHASTFAGIIAENTDPFRDVGNQTTLMSGAAWKFNIYHIAHLSDNTYPISWARTSIAALQAAGFPATLKELAGTHWDNDSGSYGTSYDLRTYGLPNLNSTWAAPSGSTNTGGGTTTIPVTPTGPTVPTVVAISPNVGPTTGGTQITIQVDSSSGCTGAAVAGAALTGFSVVDSTHVKGTTLPYPIGASVGVAVTNATGTGVKAAGFQYQVQQTPTPTPGVSGPSLRGTNVAGMEGGGTSIGSNCTNCPDATLDFYFNSGARIIRLLSTWSCFQPVLNGPIPASGNNLTYFNAYKHMVDYFTAKGARVLMSTWNPGSNGDTGGPCWNGRVAGTPGSGVTNANFADFWTKMGAIFASNPLVDIDLCNEPNNISTMQWFGTAQAAITGIRSSGFAGAIHVEGNNWSAASSWTSSSYDTASPQRSNAYGWMNANGTGMPLTDPMNNLVMHVHHYPDGGGGSTNVPSQTVTRDAIKVSVDWARANGVRVFLGEVGMYAPATNAQQNWQNFVTYMDANADTLLGFTWWAGGRHGWWDDPDASNGGHFSVTPNQSDSYGDTVNMTMIKPSWQSAL